ncbi:hypothetical protein R3P38DRAFT_2836062 [Favolaschia claudopus]|uniref:Zn(2)-C6 fungal-type domain-containing protein n=1 Tax=Favolaschia claudopus TaxID=2862362 RepID=A0AAW0E292_9AGAR
MSKLKRGKACKQCRSLKIKCDGIKPVCGTCRKGPRHDDCEYSDGPPRSRTKALEDTVSRLEARLYELEHPESSTPPVRLYDPYGPQFPPQLSPSYAGSSSRSLLDAPYQVLQVLWPTDYSSPESHGFILSPLSSPSRPSSTRPLLGNGPGNSPLGIYGSRSIAALESKTSEQKIHETLLQIFRPHACQFGFFLSWDRLTQPAHKSSALFNALYMWGAHLSSDRQRELDFKQITLQTVDAELTPETFIHTIQTQVLLAYYSFRTGHFLEARAHTATAVALTLGAGLHVIRSLNHPDAPIVKIQEENDQETRLQASADLVEEGERINGFWTVYMLQKNLTVALEPRSRVCGVFETAGMPIDTPWPLEMKDYAHGILTPDIHGDSTVCSFLDAGNVFAERSSSVAAMNVKAAILFHTAVYMHGQYRPGEVQPWWTAFGVVERLTNSLRAELLDIAQPQGQSSTRTILFTNSLLNAATIELHSIFESDTMSRQSCFVAARDMFRFGGANPQELGHLNPMMGTLWMTACNVFIDELRRVRAALAQGLCPLQAVSQQEREKEILADLNAGLKVLSFFAQESLLMGHQLAKVKKSMETT